MSATSRSRDDRISVVIATRDRCAQLLRTLDVLHAVPEQPSIVVVDNGSRDGTPAAVRSAFPATDVIELGSNRGAVARNVGVAHCHTPYCAFADDDSWWAPGALGSAADVLDRHPDVALIAAQVLVGAEERVDDLSLLMARSPLPSRPGWPGRSVLGFLACGAVVRRDAFLAVGGFDDLLFFLGEEELLAYDLAARGWGLLYVPEVVAHHHPQTVERDPSARRTRQRRNRLLVALMRRPWSVVARESSTMVADAFRDRATRSAIAQTMQRLPTSLRRRRAPDPTVEAWLSMLSASTAA